MPNSSRDAIAAAIGVIFSGPEKERERVLLLRGVLLPPWTALSEKQSRWAPFPSPACQKREEQVCTKCVARRCCRGSLR